MEALGGFLQSLRLGLGQGYHKPSDQAQQQAEAETLSASVDLEDIISEYDEPSRKSRLTASSRDGPLSQSYFSLSNRASAAASAAAAAIAATSADDETTSFYSALHDGFSIDEAPGLSSDNKYNTNTNKYNSDNTSDHFIWGHTSSPGERDMMLQTADFQITWYDLNYKIRPRQTLGALVDECRAKLFGSISFASNILAHCKPGKKYDVSSAAAAAASPAGAKAPGGRSAEFVSILRNVNGSFRSGELTAVMGPSGAGKTSLLNILSRRREDGFTGQVHVSETSHRISINAIPQHDNLPEMFTVRENLTFASRLKNPYPNQDHEKNVCRVSNLLGLDDCLDTRTRNISGGQQKRLAIAQELLSRPEILILDEPTSGLDSLTCLKTLSVLRNLVKASRIAIVLTIHQPQQEAFDLFDKVYVMANGGIVIYDGPPAKCVDFVEKFSGLTMPSADYNPASFLIEIASGEFGQEPIEALAQQVRLEYGKARERMEPLAKQHPFNQPSYNNNNHSHSSTAIEFSESIERVSNLSLDRSTCGANEARHKSELFLDSRLAKSSSVDSGKFFAKTRILTERCWKSMWRDKKHMAGRIIFHLLLPFGMASLMGTDPGHANACPRYRSEYTLMGIMKSNEYTSDEVQEDFLLAIENTGVLFMLIYSCISANIAVMTLTFALDMKSCLKEYYNGWYAMNSYVFARMLSNIPIDLTLPTATIALTYIVTGQNTGQAGDMPDIYRVGITSLAVILGSMAGQMFGMIFGAIYIGHITTALFASQGATLPFVLLSGFVMRTKNMHKMVRALCMTSLYKHCLEVAYIARYGWNVCDCDQSQLQVREPQLTGVSEKLRNFVKYYQNSQDAEAPAAEPNGTTLAPSANSDADIFQIIAKQLTLYNTYGIEVESCAQVRPFVMHDFALTEADLPVSFAALGLLLLSLLLVMLLVVKLVISYRTSL